MLAIQYLKSIPRFLAVRGLGPFWKGAATSRVGCAQLREIAPPPLPNARWLRLRPILAGICGSDLATITAKNTPYFSPLLSYPFTLGHELVGRVEEVGAAVEGVARGDKVLVEPALSCAVRGIEPFCPMCQAGHAACCLNIMHGAISPGIQTGYCRDTGGGWSESLVVHERQVLRAPEGMPDEALVLVEPLSCAVHAALKLTCPTDGTALVLGCGAIGLLLTFALRTLGNPGRIIAVYRHPHQAAFARAFGADCLVQDGPGVEEEIAALTHAERHKPEIGGSVFLGGVDVTYDCVGSAGSLDQALRYTRALGAVAVVGMPGVPRGLDWTAIWYKELRVVGTYAYGLEEYVGERLRTFELAARLARRHAAKLAPLVGARYPLREFPAAIASARFSGRSGVVKTVFEVTREGRL